MDYEWFKRRFLSISGIDLGLYKESQMKRRIDTLMMQHGIVDYLEFAVVLNTNPQALNSFLDYITINVTDFFRTPDHWQMLIESAMPLMEHPKVWCTACSTGEEPYSIAMCLAEQKPVDDIQIIATDIDDKVLEKARRGIYAERSMESVPQPYRTKYFKPVENGYAIDEGIKRCIEFRKINLLSDIPPLGLDLIVCRNVLIYFTEEAKNRLYEEFHACLNPGGFLFTGNTEQLLYYKDLGFEKWSNWLYRKK